MKTKLFILFTISLSALQAQNCIFYQKYIDKGDKELKKGNDANFEQAINDYSNALVDCPSKKEEVNAKILNAFKLIDALKNNAIKMQALAVTAEANAIVSAEIAEKERKKAEAALLDVKKANEIAFKNEEKAISAFSAMKIEKEKADSALFLANNLIEAFNFFGDSLALAFKNDKFGFINKKGETMVDYVFNNLYPFNVEKEIAFGSIDRQKYIVDPHGNKYKIYSKVKNDENIECIEYDSYQSNKFDEALLRIKRLKYLMLSSSETKDFEQFMFESKDIAYIDLSNNRISSFSNFKSNFDKVSYLNLGYNEITNTTFFSSFPNVEILDISSNKLSNFPNNIEVLAFLKRLDISNNPIKDIDTNISKLKKLNVLIANNCSIDNFHSYIADCTTLKQLELRKNKIKTIPKEIGNLVNLETLDLSHNHIEFLPENIKFLKQLKFLILNENYLKQFPEEIQYLENLIEIEIAKNDIKTLPSWLSKLPKLKKIYMAGNPITITEVPIELKNIIEF